MNFSSSQLRNSLFLAALFFCIISTFWLFGSLQEPIFYHLVGAEYHQLVTTLSFFLMMPFVFGYMVLINRYSVWTVFMVSLGMYALFFAGVAALLAHPTIGLANTHASVGRVLGWAFFAVTKTYGSFLVTLFWSFATSVTTVDMAKLIFPFVVVCAQCGSLAASTLVRIGAGWGIPRLVWCGVAGICVALVLIATMRRKMPLMRRSTAISKSGLLEGFFLLMRRPYLRGVLVISTGYLIIQGMLEYHMHILAHAAYPLIEDFAWFKGVYGQVSNTCTLLLALGGSQWLLHRWGVARTLLIFPVATAICVLFVYWQPTLWPLFAALIAIRGLAIGLNNPVKEIVYIPETQDVRFKAKSWIDMIGYRAAFSFGSQLTSLFNHSFTLFVGASTVLSLGIVGVWLYCAIIVGRHFARVTKPEETISN